MSELRTLRDFLPERLRSNYESIKNLTTVSTGIFDPADIKQLQNLINESQPRTSEEETACTTLQFFYRRNSAEFYKFLVKSKLYHLVLWTEAKRISRHFNLNDIIYINWNGSSYECSKHSNFGKPKTIETPTGLATRGSISRVRNRLPFTPSLSTNSSGFTTLREAPQ